jgi:hypothetical protein
MRGRVNRSLQLPDQFRDRTPQIARQMAYRPPVMRFRLNSDSLEKQRRRDVPRVGDEWDGHPRADGFVDCTELPRLPACPVGEYKSAANRNYEGEAEYQNAPPRFSHNSI